MREPDWMLASVVVLGFIALVLACVYESTYDARHCASDDARRAGVGLWHFDCCDREYAENKTDAGATELPLNVCPFCGTSVMGEGRDAVHG